MNEEEKFEETLQKPLDQKLRKHLSNLGQGTIFTTEDRIQLCLQNAIDRLKAKGECWTPLALSATLILTLTTAEFKDLFIPSETWLAIFLIATAASLIWTGRAIWKAIQVKVSVESIISCIKQQPPEDKKSTKLSRFTEFLKKLFGKSNDLD